MSRSFNHITFIYKHEKIIAEHLLLVPILKDYRFFDLRLIYIFCIN